MNLLMQLLSSAVLGAVAASIVNGLFNKRKLSAEATKIITDAASGVITTLRDENAREHSDRLAVHAEMTALRNDVRMQEALIAVHAFWDSQAWQILREAGIDLPAPPPLTPSRPAI